MKTVIFMMLVIYWMGELLYCIIIDMTTDFIDTVLMVSLFFSNSRIIL
jgi:hypothetical protein